MVDFISLPAKHQTADTPLCWLCVVKTVPGIVAVGLASAIKNKILTRLHQLSRNACLFIFNVL